MRPKAAPLAALLAAALGSTAEVAAADAPRHATLLYDFGAEAAGRAEEPSQAELDALLKRFPHPHAKPDAHCDPNYPATPASERSGGTLLPSVSVTHGAFSRAGADQSAYLIDYCPTGSGVPRTRRLIVLDGDHVELDLELGAGIPGEELLVAKDVTGDGLAEILLTSSVFRPGKPNQTRAALLRLFPGKPKLLGRWTGVVHCAPEGGAHDVTTTHRISFETKGSVPVFHDEATKRTCYYPP